MKKEEFQDKANRILLNHPEEKKVIIVENGQCFFNEADAQNYHHNMKFESEPQTFFREGGDNNDDLDLEEAYEKVLQENEALKHLVEQINEALSSEETVTVDAHTPEEVANIVQLREALDAEIEKNKNLEENFNSLKEAVKVEQESQNKNEDAKTKTDSKKA